MGKPEKSIQVTPDEFNPNAIEIEVFNGELAFSLNFEDGLSLAEDINRCISSIRAERRLQELLDAGRERY